MATKGIYMKKENLGIFITVLSGTIFTLCIVGYLSKLEGTTKKNQNPTETTAEAVDSKNILSEKQKLKVSRRELFSIV